jgi:hypothetical protein
MTEWINADVWARAVCDQPPTAIEDAQVAVNVAYAALTEAGRPDLAESVLGFEDEGGFYLEVNDFVLSEDEWALIDKAEQLARHAIGQLPVSR